MSQPGLGLMSGLDQLGSGWGSGPGTGLDSVHSTLGSGPGTGLDSGLGLGQEGECLEQFRLRPRRKLRLRPTDLGLGSLRLRTNITQFVQYGPCMLTCGTVGIANYAITTFGCYYRGALTLMVASPSTFKFDVL